MIPGHEFVGVVVEFGEIAAKKDRVKVGDRLISEQIVPCWDCRFCKRGQYWMCEKHDVYGFQNNVNGAFAEYMRYPKEGINHQVPKDLPLEKAILVEPFACSAYCIERRASTGTTWSSWLAQGHWVWEWSVARSDAIANDRIPTEGVVTHRSRSRNSRKGST
jgi:threonine dehydrogenase-like Zn-dependent dehydrogenase